MTPDFGRYKILSQIGRGGMSIVYQAHDPFEDRLVAIKRLATENISPEKMREFRDRFKREAKAGLQRLRIRTIAGAFGCKHRYGEQYYICR